MSTNGSIINRWSIDQLSAWTIAGSTTEYGIVLKQKTQGIQTTIQYY